MATNLRQRTTGNNADSQAGQGASDQNAIQEQLNTIFDPVTCTRKGLCPVTKLRHQEEPLESHSLYFELHGSGPEKIVCIMGLNSTSFSWAPQVEHFGRLPQYSILVFDNRGVGNSGTPKGPYSTSGMAEDVIVLLDYLGWTDPRSLHLVGISLGGMIAQELSTRVSDRLISLTLAVTTAGGMPWSNFAPLHGTISLARLLFIADPEKKIPIILEMCFTSAWLDAKAPNDPAGRTNREIQTGLYRARIAATRPQKPQGAISQMWAALTHNVSSERLHQISKSIPKVTIVTGDQDHLVKPSNSLHLSRNMPEAEYVVWDGTGHVLHMQWIDRFNELLERTFKEGKERLGSRWE